MQRLSNMTHEFDETSTTPQIREEWEDQLQLGLGECPAPDFDAWKRRHPEAAVTLAASPKAQPLSVRRNWMAGSKWIAASLVLALGFFLYRADESSSSKAFAAAIPGVDEPATMTWTTTYYTKVTSADGQRTWLQSERRLHAYLHPGHYRETFLDDAGKPRRIDITDVKTGKLLSLDLIARKAVLQAPIGHLDLRGPFAWVGEALRDRIVAKSLRVKSVSLQGRKKMDQAEATVVRAMIHKGDDLDYARHDFLFDEKSKRLVGIWIPSENDFDLDPVSSRNQPEEKEFSKMVPAGYWVHEIALDPKLASTDFSLDPPTGFTYEIISRPTITEEEMLGFLGAAARFNDGIFPDSPFAAFNQAKFNVAAQKSTEQQTVDERTLIELHDKFMLRQVHQSPVMRFLEDNTVPDSFHYVGADAKAGQADRIICWYLPKGTTKHRVVYGDLSVKDVAKTELPIDLVK